eukprot:2816324-Prymnesium_polylepis.1
MHALQIGYVERLTAAHLRWLPSCSSRRPAFGHAYRRRRSHSLTWQVRSTFVSRRKQCSGLSITVCEACA